MDLTLLLSHTFFLCLGVGLGKFYPNKIVKGCDHEYDKWTDIEVDDVLFFDGSQKRYCKTCNEVETRQCK